MMERNCVAIFICLACLIILLPDVHTAPRSDTNTAPVIPTFQFRKNMRKAKIRRPYLIELEDPDNVMEVLSRLSKSIIRANDFEYSKRGVDFGFGRGFSGAQAARHLMGLAMANDANGVGRKKRDVEAVDYN